MSQQQTRRPFIQPRAALAPTRSWWADPTQSFTQAFREEQDRIRNNTALIVTASDVGSGMQQAARRKASHALERVGMKLRPESES